MRIIEPAHPRLCFKQTRSRFVQFSRPARRIAACQSRGFSGRISRTKTLHAIELRIERANFSAKRFLVRDARFEAGEIKRNGAGAGRSKRVPKRTEHGDAPLQQLQNFFCALVHSYALSSNACFSSASISPTSGAEFA